MRYRKIVREVEAYQLTAAMIDAHLLDEAPLPKGLRLARAGYHRGNRVVYNATFSVTTIHGEDARVVVNDWIITEMDGEHFYPCKPEIFAVDYEAVGAPHPGLGSGALREALEQRIKECRETAERWETESRNVRIDRAIHKDYSLTLNALANLLERALSLSSPIEPGPSTTTNWRWMRLRAYLRQWLKPHQFEIAMDCLDLADARPIAQASSEIWEARLAALEEARQICIAEKNEWLKMERWVPADAADNCEIHIRALIRETEALAPPRQGSAKP